MNTLDTQSHTLHVNSVVSAVYPLFPCSGIPSLGRGKEKLFKSSSTSHFCFGQHCSASNYHLRSSRLANWVKLMHQTVGIMFYYSLILFLFLRGIYLPLLWEDSGGEFPCRTHSHLRNPLVLGYNGNHKLVCV